MADSSFSIYVHWPFCLKKCPYCDFNSYVRSSVDSQRWLDAFRQRLLWYKENLSISSSVVSDGFSLSSSMGGAPHVDSLMGSVSEGIISRSEVSRKPRLESIFFGGGTPSLADPWVIGGILSEIDRLWGIHHDTEISLEANPTSVTKENLESLHAAGVNRISLGVQSLNDDALKFLGRLHDVKGALRALESVQSVFNSYSFDLIYARPDQTLQGWERELKQALTFAGDHLSLYQLTFEENTPFYTKKKHGLIKELSSDVSASLYEMTRDIVAQQGFYPYEVSNYAKKGRECRHNMMYWTYRPYLGVGPGAHGRVFLDGEFCSTSETKNPERWLQSVKQGDVFECKEVLSSYDQALEMILMGMRLLDGVLEDDLIAKTGLSFEDVLDKERIQSLMGDGFLVYDQKRIKVTSKGRLYLNSILSMLF